MHDTTPIPVNVLTGFLGSGKTTLLNRWVRQASMRNTLVVINEFGEIGLDHQLLTHSDEQAVVEMSSGCLCCTLRGDLSRTLQRALDAQAAKGKPAPERVVIETTGLADPAPLLQLMMTDHWLAHRFQLDSVICCIDAANGDATLRTHRESQRQVAVADRLLITKTDLVDEHLLSALANQLATLNPAAEQWQVLSGNLNPELLVGAGLYQAGTGRYRVESWLKSASYHTTSLASGQPEDSGEQQSLAPLAPPSVSAHHDDQIKSFCFSVEERIRPEALENWLDLLMAMMGDRMLRMKAIVHLQGRDTPLALHGVQHIFHPPASLPAHCVSDQVSRFVFITHNVSPETVRQLYTFFNGTIPSSSDDLVAD
ncbi:GTP-binding protein [Halomonas sp. NyZ770]|uniref:CobW family GTP-binding protein n=1 Tax=Halomonas sp. NyZ770 TaxID=2883106 RepID=UPI001D0A5867|nr:GTP-binding protein [Halomonas sp. NyZ770]UDM08084.1 GTP-binding protein [Halomonas sp. NyZ770]